jgi:Ras-related protein Rab-1A
MSSFIDSTLISHVDVPYDMLLKCLLIGNSGVGKSAIVDRYVDNSFHTTFISTIGVDFRPVDFETSDGQTVKLQIWDTAGQERFRSIATTYYRGVQGIILTYDLTDPSSLHDIEQVWLREVENYAKEDVVLILVGNKKDLVNRSHPSSQRRTEENDEEVSRSMTTSSQHRCELEIAQSIEAFTERYPHLIHMQVSAKTGENVSTLFHTLCSKLVEVQQEKRSRQATSQMRREQEQQNRRILLGSSFGRYSFFDGTNNGGLFKRRHGQQKEEEQSDMLTSCCNLS